MASSVTPPKVISRTSSDLDTDYKWGFTIDIEADVIPKGLSEDVVRLISNKKGEPEWMVDWRLKAYRHWVKLDCKEPDWANIHHPAIDFQDIIYYAAPGSKPDGWLEAIYSHVSGDDNWIALSDLIAEVESSRKLRGEAHFHAGVISLATGRRQEAVNHFQHAVHAADGALGYTFHAGVVLERLRLDSSWPVWMDSTFS